MTTTYIESAKQAFHFLEKDGFSLAQSNDYELNYKKLRVFVSITWSPRSGELEVFIGYQGNGIDQDNTFSLTDILRMEGAFPKESTLPFQVSDKEKLSPFLQKLAAYVNSFAQPALAGDKMYYRRLAAYRSRQARSLMSEIMIRNIRIKAEAAWQKKDYVKVIEFYSSVDINLLTKTEMKRLKYAKENS